MNKDYTYYRRNLPHYQPPGFTFFVTFRLDGSLPMQKIRELKKERELEQSVIAECKNEELRAERLQTHRSRYFGKFDKLLDGSSYGPQWLREDGAADIVKEALHFRDTKDYDLFAYTIMPNHVHIVFKPIAARNGVSSCIVTKILQDLKKFTAVRCNQLLNRTGAFWQHESYDHVVRDEAELARIIAYVLNNPVKAKLCAKWEDWKYNYCKL